MAASWLSWVGVAAAAVAVIATLVDLISRRLTPPKDSSSEARAESLIHGSELDFIEVLEMKVVSTPESYEEREQLFEGPIAL